MGNLVKPRESSLHGFEILRPVGELKYLSVLPAVYSVYLGFLYHSAESDSVQSEAKQ